MKITVRRSISNNNATTSLVLIDGDFECFGLEDEYREHKVMHETRIPAGEYPVRVRTFGGFHNRYQKRFAFHKGMLEVCNVLGFSDILIHIGNTDDDTSGCLLVGQSINAKNPFFIGSSTTAYKQLYKKVISAAAEGDLTIKYIDEDIPCH
jgi:hypothetical protein